MMNQPYIVTLREHRYANGTIIPKDKKLPIVEENSSLVTVEFSGQTFLLRKSQVKVYSSAK